MIASITTVAGQRFLPPAALNRTDQLAHRFSQTYGDFFRRAENKGVAGTVTHANLLTRKGSSSVVGKLTGEFTDRDLHG